VCTTAPLELRRIHTGGLVGEEDLWLLPSQFGTPEEWVRVSETQL
jgi:hypothetical protein